MLPPPLSPTSGEGKKEKIFVQEDNMFLRKVNGKFSSYVR